MTEIIHQAIEGLDPLCNQQGKTTCAITLYDGEGVTCKKCLKITEESRANLADEIRKEHKEGH